MPRLMKEIAELMTVSLVVSGNDTRTEYEMPFFCELVSVFPPPFDNIPVSAADLAAMRDCKILGSSCAAS